MRQMPYLMTFCAVFASDIAAQTVVVNENVVLELPSVPGDFRLTVSQNLADNLTSVWLNYSGTQVSYATANADEGADVYLVHPGYVFNKANIDAGELLPIVTATAPVSYPPVNVGAGDFYLGINTGIGFGPDFRSVFGWVQLKRTNPIQNLLTLGERVMSYGSLGIVAGTTTLVPEPTAATHAFVTMLIATTLRKRHRVESRLAVDDSVSRK